MIRDMKNLLSKFRLAVITGPFYFVGNIWGHYHQLRDLLEDFQALKKGDFAMLKLLIPSNPLEWILLGLFLIGLYAIYDSIKNKNKIIHSSDSINNNLENKKEKIINAKDIQDENLEKVTDLIFRSSDFKTYSELAEELTSYYISNISNMTKEILLVEFLRAKIREGTKESHKLIYEIGMYYVSSDINNKFPNPSGRFEDGITDYWDNYNQVADKLNESHLTETLIRFYLNVNGMSKSDFKDWITKYASYLLHY